MPFYNNVLVRIHAVSPDKAQNTFFQKSCFQSVKRSLTPYIWGGTKSYSESNTSHH